MSAAISESRPFDVILLDDSSRLPRDTKDALTIFERLNFAGIRLIAVSQGIDSQDEQVEKKRGGLIIRPLYQFGWLRGVDLNYRTLLRELSCGRS
jgi:DNA invertase Pin-like site-specific DNA recombinase